MARDEVLSLGTLSDGELLRGLSGLLQSSRRAMAGILAHLGEVEQRRLHLRAGYPSMFAYCVSRLGMSEDEACRRIEVARLARRFPILLAQLAGARVSLSVAALLKAHLTDANHAALLAAVAGKTVEQSREVLACWFPRPDVAASIRKLPVRTASAPQQRRDEPAGEDLIGGVNTRHDATDVVTGTAVARVDDPQHIQSACGAREVGSLNEVVGDLSIGSNGAAMPACEAAHESVGVLPSGAPVTRASDSRLPGASHSVAVGIAGMLAWRADDSRPRSERGEPVCAATPPALRPRRSSTSRSIEPLAADRYKIQFTAGGDLKRKLELARDLLRHAVPDGDLATIVGRALDTLIDRVMKRRFASTAAATLSASRNIDAPTKAPGDGVRGDGVRGDGVRGDGVRGDNASSEPVSPKAAQPPGVDRLHTDAIDAAATIRTESLSLGKSTEDNHRASAVTSSSRRRRPANSVRRAVVSRDGARCTWRGPDGRRCGSRAWLEHDHVTPFAQGGDSTPFNTRLLCRAHNRLAAEQAYGQATITRIIAGRRRARQQRNDALRARDVAEGGTMDSAPAPESQRARQHDPRGRHER